MGPNPSRVDIFLGYSYFGAHGQVKPAGINYKSINIGGIASAAYYFNKYVGAEIVLVAHPGDGEPSTPFTNNGLSNNDALYTASGGLIVRAPMQNFTLFAHGLAGAARIAGPNSDALASFEHEPYRTGPALTAGGGMDYDLPFFDHRFSLRLFEADYRYVHANFGPSTATVPTFGVLGGRTNLNGVDLSTGIVTHFGHIIPPPPVTFSCAVSPSSVYPGDPVTITGTAMNLNPKKTAVYTWSATNGAVVTGNSSTVTVDTKSLAANTYTVKGHVSEGNKPGQMADCSVDFTVKAFEPPTISCSANPSTVSPGDSSTITAQGVSPQNRPLTYSYSATAGNISGNTSTATLSTTGAAPGQITVTCSVVDDKGQSAMTTTSVTVVAPQQTVAAPTTQQLCSINFDRDPRRPARVDNEGKACLDDLALNLQRTTDSTLAVTGNATTGARMHDRLASERAVNVKDYLVKEKGIDGSRIMVFTGTQDANVVTDTLVPSGATLDKSNIQPVDESVIKAQPRTAGPAHRTTRRHRKHHKAS